MQLSAKILCIYLAFFFPLWCGTGCSWQRCAFLEEAVPSPTIHLQSRKKKLHERIKRCFEPHLRVATFQLRRTGAPRPKEHTCERRERPTALRAHAGSIVRTTKQEKRFLATPWPWSCVLKRHTGRYSIRVFEKLIWQSCLLDCALTLPEGRTLWSIFFYYIQALAP